MTFFAFTKCYNLVNVIAVLPYSSVALLSTIEFLNFDKVICLTC